MIKALIAGILLAITTPTITTQDAGATFNISYDRGAIWSCVVYRMVEATESDKSNWPDGHYAPRSCGELDQHSTTFVEEWNLHIYDPKTGKPYNIEWDVYAEIQYPVNGKTDEFTTIETNRVRVTK